MDRFIGPRQDSAWLTPNGRRRGAVLFVVALGAASGAVSAADIFKCRNADGQLAYQSEPCDSSHKTMARWNVAEAKPARPSMAARSAPASIAIELSPNGTYYVEGTVNGIPTRFQIDTGATSVSIPTELAYRAGMVCKAEGVSNTANGVAKVCHSAVRQVTFGPFTLEDFPATMLPNLDVPLIGMNALRRLHMEQRDGILTLSF